MKTTKTLSLGSILLAGMLAVSGTALAGNIAPDHGLDHGHQVPPLDPVKEAHDSGINLAARQAPTPGISLAPAAGVEGLEHRASTKVLVDTRTDYHDVVPLAPAAGVDAFEQRSR